MLRNTPPPSTPALPESRHPLFASGTAPRRPLRCRPASGKLYPRGAAFAELGGRFEFFSAKRSY
eukprot:1385138-Pyramimonas_sp.AAC.1